MPSHLEIYFKLLDSRNFEHLKRLMIKQNVYKTIHALESSLEQRDGFPFVLMKIDSKEIFAAQMVGFLIQIEQLIPEHTDPYYFPVIAMADGYDAKISNLFNPETAIIRNA
jgi:hypothetical protein